MEHKLKMTVVNNSTYLTLDRMKEIANYKLAQTNLSQDEKKGVCEFLEEALFQMRQKVKFDYLHWEMKGRTEWLDSGGEDWKRPHYEKGEEEPGMGEYSRIYR